MLMLMSIFFVGHLVNLHVSHHVGHLVSDLVHLHVGHHNVVSRLCEVLETLTECKSESVMDLLTDKWTDWGRC